MLSSTFGIKNVFFILIIFVAVFLMYTRSAMIAAFFILVVSLVFRLKLYPTSVNIKKILLGMLFFITVSFILINYIFENQFYYFKSRTDEIVKAGSVVEEKNFDLRTQIIFSRIEKVLTINPLFGLGFIWLIVFTYSDFLLQFWLGNSYRQPMATTFNIILLGYYFSLLSIPTYYAIIGLGNTATIFRSAFIGGLFNLIILFILYLFKLLSFYLIIVSFSSSLFIISCYLFYYFYRVLAMYSTVLHD